MRVEEVDLGQPAPADAPAGTPALVVRYLEPFPDPTILDGVYSFAALDCRGRVAWSFNPDPPPALRTEAQEAAFGQGGKRLGAEAWPRHVEHPDVQSDAAHTRDPKPNPRVGGGSGFKQAPFEVVHMVGEGRALALGQGPRVERPGPDDVFSVRATPIDPTGAQGAAVTIPGLEVPPWGVFPKSTALDDGRVAVIGDVHTPAVGGGGDGSWHVRVLWLDATGAVVAERPFDDGPWRYVEAMAPGPAGSLVVGAQTCAGGHTRALLSLDAAGEVRWALRLPIDYGDRDVWGLEQLTVQDEGCVFLSHGGNFWHHLVGVSPDGGDCAL